MDKKDLLKKLKYSLRWLPDEAFIKLYYRLRIHRPCNLENPKTFSEKLQWLKLHDHNPIYTDMVDKIEAKKIAASIIGEEHIIPTLGVWDSFDDIDFDALPEQFVLKCSHDSGGLVIVRDKSKLDKKAARKIIEKAMRCNFYYIGREWPYKNVKPRILAEQYLDPNTVDGDLYDYKLLRFTDGRLVMQAMTDRFTDGKLSKTFFDEEWHPLPASEGGQPTCPDLVCPEHFEQMKEMARKLGEGMPFVRVDFYESNGGLYFGELTFYPKSGFERFEPDEWDEKFGSWIDLTEIAGGGWLLVSETCMVWMHEDAGSMSAARALPDLTDYKVMCFNGKARCVFTCTGRAEGDLHVDFFDTNWNHMPFTRRYPNADVPPEAPRSLKDMLTMAEQLAEGIPFVRTDFYEVADELYFGELTFYPGSGVEEFEPDSWDEELGSWLELPESFGGGVAPCE